MAGGDDRGGGTETCFSDEGRLARADRTRDARGLARFLSDVTGWGCGTASGRPVDLDFEADPPDLDPVLPVLELEEIERRWQVDSDSCPRHEVGSRDAARPVRCGIWAWDLATDRAYGSPEFYEMVGLGPPRDSASGSDLARRIGFAEPDCARKHLRAALRSGDGFEFEVAIVHPRRGVRWISSRGRAFRYAKGRSVCLVGMNVDVTASRRVEREREEEASRRTAEASRIQAVLSSIMGASITLDGQMRLIDVNSVAMRLLFPGRLRDEVLGQAFAALTQSEAAPSCLLRFEETLRSGLAAHFETKLAAGNCWLEAHAYPVDGRVEVHLRNVTDRKWAEELLRVSEAELTLVLDSVPLGVFVADARGNIKRCNLAARRIWGGLRFGGREPHRDYGLWWDGEGKPVEGEDYPWTRALMQGKTSTNEVFAVLDFDGDCRTVRCSAAPIRDEFHKILGAVCVLEDISERRREEEQRVLLQRRLVTAQEDERRRLARELHDQVGQYVTAIGLTIGTLKGVTHDAVIAEKLTRLDSMTTGLAKDLRRIACELRPSTLDDFGLGDALAHYVAEWESWTGIEVDLHLHGLDARRLSTELETSVYRIAQEALTNVARHAHARHVSIIVSVRDDQIRAIVEDDGQGPATEASLRGDAANECLGLLGMRERATLLGGKLELETTPGQGTTVYLSIPIRG